MHSLATLLLKDSRLLQRDTGRDMTSRRPRVFVTHSDIPATAINLLREKCEVILCPELPTPNRADIVRNIREVDAIFWCTQNKLDAEIMDLAGPGLRVIATMSAGYEHVDVAEAHRRGVQIGHTPNVNTRAVAEIAMALLLEVARRIPEARQCITVNEWFPFRPQWMMGKDIVGSTVGIIGLGGIGQAIAKRIKPFEIARLLYFGPKVKLEGDALGAEFVSFEELLRQSDFVVIACPLNDATRRLFNDETFALMKPSAILINIARGGIVDQGALIRALQSGQIWGAGLDVMTPEPLPADDPLFQLKNCVVAPHLGGMTERTQAAMAVLTARNIIAALDGTEMPAPIIL